MQQHLDNNPGTGPGTRPGSTTSPSPCAGSSTAHIDIAVTLKSHPHSPRRRRRVDLDCGRDTARSARSATRTEGYLDSCPTVGGHDLSTSPRHRSQRRWVSFVRLAEHTGAGPHALRSLWPRLITTSPACHLGARS